MLEIQKTFDFFKATAASDRIDRIMVSGGASRAEGLHRDARRALRGAGRSRSIRSRRSRSTPRSSRSTPPTSAPTAAVAVGPRAAPGGRPMIRINLLAVERERAEEAARALIPAAQRVTDRRQPDPARHGARHRLVVLVAAPAVDRARRRTSRSAEAETQQLALGARAGAEVRDRARRSCSSASRSSSSCASGQSGAGARPRRDQPQRCPIGCGSTDLKQAGNDFTLDGLTTSMTALSDFVAQPREHQRGSRSRSRSSTAR